MRQSQLPLLGLLLVLFVGARAGIPGGASEGAPAAGSAGKGYSSPSQLAKAAVGRGSKRSRTQTPTATTLATASDVVQSGCDELTAASKAGAFHISKSQRTSTECLPPLPAIYRILCQLNPEYSSNDELRHRFEFQELQAKKPMLPDCLTNVEDGLGISTVMASVPDPEHTHLGLLADRAIEAIQVAAGKRGYDPYSHFLPWASSDVRKNPDNGSDGEFEADSHEPGILIFRRQDSSSSPPPHYLVVFLIRELPTTGLDQESFHSAKELADQISEQRHQSKPQVIWFAGPNFSGSLASLSDVDRPVDPCIHAFSGQVTAATYFNRKAKCESTLALTQTSDSEAVQLFKSGMQSYGYRPEEIAVLSEGGTMFGNKVAKRDKAMEPDSVLQHSPVCSALSLQFPREISKLRNLYGAETGTTTGSTGATSQQTGDVQMSWQDSQATRGDDVPTYGGQQTPLSQEAVLSTLGTALKACQIRVLGIFATDPMDEAFLMRSFRKSSPDVRLFLRDPDLLYLRTPDAASLNGTLLVNNYPLVVRNQLWSADDSGNNSAHDGLVTFSSAAQEAQYDAFLLLLNEMENPSPDAAPPELVEWNRPAGNPHPNEAQVKATSVPPLWLSVLGTAGHLPLAILNVDEPTEKKLLPRSLDVNAPHTTSKRLWFFFAVLGLLHVWGLSRPSGLPRLFSDDFDLGDVKDAITSSKAVCHVAILLSLALIQLVLGSSFLFFRGLNGYVWLAWGVILVTSLLVVTACVVFMVRVARPCWQSRSGASFRNEEVSGIVRPLWGGILCIGIFATIGIFWVRAVLQPTFKNAFLHFRDLIPACGVAPCLPISVLLAVAYLAAWAYLRRLTYWGYRRPPLPTVALDITFSSDFTKTVRSIDQCLLGFLGSRGWAFGFILAFVVGFLGFRPRSNMDMTEAPSVHWVFVTLFALAFFALGLNWFRFVNIWFRLRNVLEGLERLPIRHAFERMPAEKSMPIWGWGISENSFLPTSQTIERLRALVLADNAAVSPLSVRELRSRMSALEEFGQQKRQGIWNWLFLMLGGSREELVELPRAVGAPRMVVSVKTSRERLIVRPDTPTFSEVLNSARQAMTEVVHQLILFLRPDYWQRGSDGSKQEMPPPSELRTFVLAEDLVAMRYYTYIRYVVTELRNLLFFVAIAFSLLFLAFHTYAFRADQAIDWSFLGLFLIVGGGVTLVLYQMELDPILSHFGGGQAGEVGLSFYLNLLKYGAVPLLTIIGSQVPAVSNLLLQWVQPTLQSLH